MRFTRTRGAIGSWTTRGSRSRMRVTARPGAAAWCGVVAALVAATRPDAILYAVAPAAIFAWCAPAGRRRALLGAYAATAGGIVALGLALRVAYFHALVPNTYFAKGGARPL